MIKKLQKYFSLIKEIQPLQDELTNLVEKEKLFENMNKQKEEDLIVNIVEEFSNLTVVGIVNIVKMLLPTKSDHAIERRIWNMLNYNILVFGNDCCIYLKPAKKRTRKIKEIKIQPPYLGDPVWESKNEISMNLLNIVDSIKNKME